MNPQIAENARKRSNLTTAKAVENSGTVCYLKAPMSGSPLKKIDPFSTSDEGLSEEENKKRWLTVKELADYLGSTPGAIRNMVYREQLSAYKPFGLLLFDKNEIDRIIKSHPVRGWYEKD